MLWANGRYDLGMSESEFWGLTFRKHYALLERVKANNQMREMQTAYVAAFFATGFFGQNGKVFEPKMFMMTKLDQEPEQEMTSEQNWSYIQLLNKQMGGDENLT